MVKFFKREPVLIISFLCAAVSMVFVPPSEEYAEYFDWKVISLLFCLMVVVAGLQNYGLFEVFSQKLLSGRKNMRLLSFILVMLPFFASMFITNDVALITFVPFTILVLSMIERRKYLIFIISMQTIAANLGSMATPVGNPQSLFLYSKYQIAPQQFFSIMLPLVIVSFVFVGIGCLFVKNEQIHVEFMEKAQICSNKKLAMCCVMFILSLLGVFGVLPYWIVLGIVVLAIIIFDRSLFAKVDYCLLITFICFFVFAGNMGRIEAVKECLSGLLEQNTMFTVVLASQIISNVPAAVLLSEFTNDISGMLVGTNVGGLGTLIASLASLISFKYYVRQNDSKPLKYFGIFTLLNIIGLGILIFAAFLYL